MKLTLLAVLAGCRGSGHVCLGLLVALLLGASALGCSEIPGGNHQAGVDRAPTTVDLGVHGDSAIHISSDSNGGVDDDGHDGMVVDATQNDGSISLDDATPLTVDRVLAIPAVYEDNLGRGYDLWNPFDPATLPDRMDLLRTYIEENSYGRQSVDYEITSTVVVPLDDLPDQTLCPVSTLIDRGLEQVAALGTDWGPFDVVAFVPPIGVCGPRGNMVGPLIERYAFVPTDDDTAWRILLHEYGHSLGLQHAKKLRCGSSPHVAFSLERAACTENEYGNYDDVMGRSANGHFSAQAKEYLGWIEPQEIHQPGTYVLEPIERVPSAAWVAASGYGAGQVPFRYYFEYKRLTRHLGAFGIDACGLTVNVSGIDRYVGDRMNKPTFLLDLRPEQLTDERLYAGDSFALLGTDWTVTVQSCDEERLVFQIRATDS